MERAKRHFSVELRREVCTGDRNVGIFSTEMAAEAVKAEKVPKETHRPSARRGRERGGARKGAVKADDKHEGTLEAAMSLTERKGVKRY